MKIYIKTIPHGKQRYDTIGDWQFVSTPPDSPLGKIEGLLITVSELDKEGKKQDSEFLVAIHELIEAYLCKRKGITTQQVDEFDFNFKGDGEPGDDLNAPYHNEHVFATSIERVICEEELGMTWEEHDSNCYGYFVEETK